jgi:hypothetical protein
MSAPLKFFIELASIERLKEATIGLTEVNKSMTPWRTPRNAASVTARVKPARYIEVTGRLAAGIPLYWSDAVSDGWRAQSLHVQRVRS